MTAYITKYALIGGITEKEGMIGEDCKTMFVTVKNSFGFSECFHGDDWHTTMESAVAKAESMRLKKIASMKKQIAKLEQLTFTEPK